MGAHSCSGESMYDTLGRSVETPTTTQRSVLNIVELYYPHIIIELGSLIIKCLENTGSKFQFIWQNSLAKLVKVNLDYY